MINYSHMAFIDRMRLMNTLLDQYPPLPFLLAVVVGGFLGLAPTLRAIKCAPWRVGARLTINRHESPSL